MDERIHGIKHWKIERPAGSAHALLRLMTPGDVEVSFAIGEEMLAQMAELMGEFHAEAFPRDVRFH